MGRNGNRKPNRMIQHIFVRGAEEGGGLEEETVERQKMGMYDPKIRRLGSTWRNSILLD